MHENVPSPAVDHIGQCIHIWNDSFRVILADTRCYSVCRIALRGARSRLRQAWHCTIQKLGPVSCIRTNSFLSLLGNLFEMLRKYRLSCMHKECPVLRRCSCVWASCPNHFFLSLGNLASLELLIFLVSAFLCIFSYISTSFMMLSYICDTYKTEGGISHSSAFRDNKH